MKKLQLRVVLLLSIVCNLLACANTPSQSSNNKGVLAKQATSNKIQPSIVIPYKQINNGLLSLHIFLPKKHGANDSRSAIVFFHGGGWKKGSATQFYKQSQYLANKGMVAISAEYRIESLHGTIPKESIKDGKSAIRWLRVHAQELGINPNMIAAGGGSAGGQVAAATGTATSFEEVKEDKSVSHRPNALVLFNPVFDNGPNGFGYHRVKDYWQQFSPLHNINEETPPTIGFFGEKDALISLDSVQSYQQRMKEVGVEFETHIYKGQHHGFFNKAKYQETLLAMTDFLQKLGYIKE